MIFRAVSGGANGMVVCFRILRLLQAVIISGATARQDIAIDTIEKESFSMIEWGSLLVSDADAVFQRVPATLPIR